MVLLLKLQYAISDPGMSRSTAFTAAWCALQQLSSWNSFFVTYSYEYAFVSFLRDDDNEDDDGDDDEEGERGVSEILLRRA